MANQYYEQTAKLSALAQCGATDVIQRPNLKDSLRQQLLTHEGEIRRLTELLKLLENNPETDRILELLGRNY